MKTDKELFEDHGFKLGLPLEIEKRLFQQIFPEIAHISQESSEEERASAFDKLRKRLQGKVTKEEIVKTKVLGWVGYVDNKPCWDITCDDYTTSDDPSMLAMNIFKSKKEAHKRFQDVRPVVELKGKKQ